MQHSLQHIEGPELTGYCGEWNGYTPRVEPWRQVLVDAWKHDRLTLDELVERSGLNRGTIHRILDNKTKDPAFTTVPVSRRSPNRCARPSMGHLEPRTTQKYTHIRPVPEAAAMRALARRMSIADAVGPPPTKKTVGKTSGTRLSKTGEKSRKQE